MKNEFKLIGFFVLSSMILSSCSLFFHPDSDHEEKLNAIVPNIKCGLIYHRNNFIYKDSQGEHNIDEHILDNIATFYPNLKQARVSYCFTKNNKLFSETVIKNEDKSIEYSLDCVNVNNWEVTHFYSFSQQEMFDKFSLSEDEYSLSSRTFSCCDGLYDAANIDYQFFVPKRNNDGTFDFDLIFDVNDYHLLRCKETPRGIDEKEECLKRTGATFGAIDSNRKYLEVDGEKYIFDDSYLLNHSDYYSEIRGIYGTNYEKYFKRVDNYLYFSLKPVIGQSMFYNRMMFKIDVPSKTASYLGYISPDSDLYGVIYQ